jgi:glycosyltransferase involved in cell wall biosynthesis
MNASLDQPPAKREANPEAGVSVVIPAYNYARYLTEAVQSVLEQTFPSLEVIVVDDGSTDDTAEVVRRFADPRVRYVWQANAGLSAARNTGISHARYPFVAFLDADDRWLPTFLSEVMQRFEHLDPSFGLIASLTGRIDGRGAPQPLSRHQFRHEGELTQRDFILRNRPLSSSLVARRTVFDECGLFDTALRSSEDRDMWIRATARRRFWLIETPLALIRRHDSNMSKNAERMKQNSRAVIVKALRSGAARWDFPFWLQVFSVHFFQIAWTHFDARQRIRAILYLGASVVLWPIFLRPERFFEPPLFRLRAAWNFCRAMLQPPNPTERA